MLLIGRLADKCSCCCCCCCFFLRADPFVEVGLNEKGEHVLGAAGEVHLETCIKDLKERFARIELQVTRRKVLGSVAVEAFIVALPWSDHSND